MQFVFTVEGNPWILYLRLILEDLENVVESPRCRDAMEKKEVIGGGGGLVQKNTALQYPGSKARFQKKQNSRCMSFCLLETNR